MDLSKILQESIIHISAQVFLNRLVLFNLINNNEYETLKYSTAQEQQQNGNNTSTLTTFIEQKLNNENAVFHERFKLFLGYYNDLKSFYHNWETLGKTLAGKTYVYFF